jgi:hypothetical protein
MRGATQCHLSSDFIYTRAVSKTTALWPLMSLWAKLWLQILNLLGNDFDDKEENFYGWQRGVFPVSSIAGNH